MNLKKVQVLDREARYFERGVKEAIYIRANRPSPNCGWNKLPIIYDSVIARYVVMVNRIIPLTKADEDGVVFKSLFCYNIITNTDELSF